MNASLRKCLDVLGSSLVALVGAYGQAPQITSQPQDTYAQTGFSAVFYFGVASQEPLWFQWFHGTQSVAGANTSTLTLSNLSSTMAGDYFAVATNAFGAVTSAPVSLVVLPPIPGTLDPADLSANNVVRAIKVDSDGSAYVGGAFTLLNDQPRARLGRLNANGTLDPGYAPLINDSNGFAAVYAIAIQTNHQVIVGGNFTSVNGTSRRSLARLNPDGTLDDSFDVTFSPAPTIWSVALQPDGKILIGGEFTNVQNGLAYRIARLNSNGTLDNSFVTGSGFNSGVRAIAVQPDGAILVGGFFTFAQGNSYFVRLTASGALDSFLPSGPNGFVDAIKLQPNGDILLGGGFTTIGGVARAYLARLTSEGILDATFNPRPSGTVTSIELQPDGKILVGGGFYNFGGVSRPYFARLESNGVIDPSFYPYAAADSWVETIALALDSSVLLGGDFSRVNGVERPFLARLIGGETPPPYLPIFTTQPPRDVIVREGGNVSISAAVLGWPFPGLQWRFNGTNLPAQNAAVLLRNNIRLPQAGQYDVVASNSIGATTSRVSTVTVIPARTGPGAVDVNYYAGTGPAGGVRSIAIQTDNKAVISGWFASVDDLAQPYLARLGTNGTVDATFRPILDYGVTSVANAPGGRLAIAGYFSHVNLVPASGFALLEANGSLAPGFSAQVSTGGVVLAFTFQTNGQPIIAGWFITSAGGPLRTNLARLTTSGTVDPTFHAGAGVNGYVLCVAMDGNGRVLVGGDFDSVNGVARRRVARLNANGSVDTTFDPGSGANGDVEQIVVLPNGKIFIGGRFRSFNGVVRHSIARLLPDGKLDLDFDPGTGPDGAVVTLLPQPAGRILIGGGFDLVDGIDRANLARLNNDGSLDMTFDPGAGANGLVEAIAELPGNRLLVGGGFTYFDALPRPYIVELVAGEVAPLAPMIVAQSGDEEPQAGEDVTLSVLVRASPAPTYQWRLFGTNIPGATSWTFTLHDVRSEAGGEYDVFISNSVGHATSLPIVLTVGPPSREPGAPDINFSTGAGPNDRVYAVAVQPNRRILIGGAFTDISGVSHSHVARLLPTGGDDVSFNIGKGANDHVFAFALQTNGQVVVAGRFTNFNNFTRQRIARLNPGGSVDPTFDAGLGANADIYAIAIQTNGQVIIGGGFSTVAGQPRNGLARLQPNGTLDATFAPPLGSNAFVYALAIEPDGGIIAGGSFTGSGATTLYNLARFTVSGTVDPTFSSYGPSGPVRVIALTSSNAIVIGGEFFSVGGYTRTRLARLQTNGVVDQTFTNYGVNKVLNAIAIEPPLDNVVLGGAFTALFRPGFISISRNRLARLHSNGGPDYSFDTSVGVHRGTSYIDEYGSYYEQTAVLAITRDQDGQLLIGGDFTSINNIERPFIARVFSRQASAAVAVHKGQGTVQLTWDTGRLQVAAQINGPWIDINTQSPTLYSVTNRQQFFRLKFN